MSVEYISLLGNTPSDFMKSRCTSNGTDDDFEIFCKMPHCFEGIARDIKVDWSDAWEVAILSALLSKTNS